ncbi:MAG: molybdenum cofactor biosynthesis protein MoaE [Fuerstiella sp.]
MIKLTEKTINYQQVTEAVRSHNAGAVVLFLGTVREFTGDVHTASLEYDSYPAMAIQAMEQLKSEACECWSLQDVAIVHRTGKLELGEIAVAVAVSSAHRREAFEAGQWLLDTLKQRVPIWKKELYVDGRTEWVHPTQKSPPVVDSARSTISESKQ